MLIKLYSINNVFVNGFVHFFEIHWEYFEFVEDFLKKWNINLYVVLYFSRIFNQFWRNIWINITKILPKLNCAELFIDDANFNSSHLNYIKSLN